MTLSAPSVTLSIVDGGLSENPAPPLGGPLWILGPTSAGTAEDPFRSSRPSEIKSSFGHGPAVEAALQALNKNVTECVLMRVDPTGGTAGTYGTITVVSAGAGITVAGDGTTKPADDWEPAVRWTVGGTVGTSGPKYQYSLDNGGKWSGEIELGAASSITLPNGGGKYNLTGHELSMLCARINDLADQLNAHAADATVHGVADPAAPYTIVTATDDASVITACTQLLAAANAHTPKISGGVHGAADTTAAAILAGISAPSSRAEAITFCAAIDGVLFGDGVTTDSGHTLRTVGTVHSAPDATNVLTSDVAVAGDIVAGDSFSLATAAPRWSIDKLLDALDVFGASVATFSGVLEIVGPVLTSAEAQAIEDKLEELSTPNRDVRAIGHWRMRNAGESQQAYAAAFLAAHPLAASSGRKGRLALCGSWYQPSNLVPGATSPRPFSFAIAPRLARSDVPPASHPINKAVVGTFSGALRANNGVDVLPRACDESSYSGFTPARLWVPMTRGQSIVSSIGVTLAEDGSDFAQIQYGRIIDAVKRFSKVNLEDRLGQQVAPKPGTVYIDPAEAERIEQAERKRILDAFGGSKNQIVAARVVVDRNSVVSGAGSKVVYVDIYVTPPGYIEIVVGRLQFAL